jgi:hypothetical protein
MIRMARWLLAAAFALPLLLPSAVRAAESYDACTGFITVLPATIASAGTWCLDKHLTTSAASGTAIKINVDNVTVDCNGWRLDGVGAGAGTLTTGIGATARLNATVRNCHVRGFYYGTYLTGGGHLVEDNLFEGNTYQGIHVRGDGSTVRRNRVLDTGGSSAITAAFGIATYYSVDIVDNTVSGVLASTGSAGGIQTTSNLDASITGNRIRGVVPGAGAASYGVNNSTSDRLLMRGNELTGTGLPNSYGLRCSNAHGRARDNVINGYATALSTCANDGDNVIVP